MNLRNVFLMVALVGMFVSMGACLDESYKWDERVAHNNVFLQYELTQLQNSLDSDNPDDMVKASDHILHRAHTALADSEMHQLNISPEMEPHWEDYNVAMAAIMLQAALVKQSYYDLVNGDHEGSMRAIEMAGDCSDIATERLASLW